MKINELLIAKRISEKSEMMKINELLIANEFRKNPKA